MPYVIMSSKSLTVTVLFLYIFSYFVLVAKSTELKSDTEKSDSEAALKPRKSVVFSENISETKIFDRPSPESSNDASPGVSIEDNLESPDEDIKLDEVDLKPSEMLCESFTSTSLDLSTLDDNILENRPPQQIHSETSSTTTEGDSEENLQKTQMASEDLDDVLAHLQTRNLGSILEQPIAEESTEELVKAEMESEEKLEAKTEDKSEDEKVVEHADEENPKPRGDFNVPAGFKEIPFKPLVFEEKEIKVANLEDFGEKPIEVNPKNISIFEANKPKPVKKAEITPEVNAEETAVVTHEVAPEVTPSEEVKEEPQSAPLEVPEPVSPSGFSATSSAGPLDAECQKIPEDLSEETLLSITPPPPLEDVSVEEVPLEVEKEVIQEVTEEVASTEPEVEPSKPEDEQMVQPEVKPEVEVSVEPPSEPSMEIEVEPEDDPEDEGKMGVLKRSSSTTTLESVDVTCSTELAAASSSGEGNFMTESELKRLSCDVEEFSESDKMEIQTINSSKKIEVIHETIVTEIKRTGNDLNCLCTGIEFTFSREFSDIFVPKKFSDIFARSSALQD